MTRLILSCAALAALSPFALGAVTPTSQTRHTSVSGTIWGSSSQVTDTRLLEARDFGPFVNADAVDLTLEGTGSECNAAHSSGITPRRIHADLSSAALADTTGVLGVAQSDSRTGFHAAFSVTVAQTWRLDAVIPNISNSACALASIVIRRNNQTIATLSSWQPGRESHLVLDLQPGEYTVNAYTNTGVVVCGGPNIEQADASIRFILRDLTDARPGDANDDGAVNFGDLNRVLANFGVSGVVGFVSGDLDLDGRVTFTDLNLVLAFFGSGA